MEAGDRDGPRPRPRTPEDLVLYVDLIHHLLANGVIDDELEVLVRDNTTRN